MCRAKCGVRWKTPAGGRAGGLKYRRVVCGKSVGRQTVLFTTLVLDRQDRGGFHNIQLSWFFWRNNQFRQSEAGHFSALLDRDRNQDFRCATVGGPEGFNRTHAEI